MENLIQAIRKRLHLRKWRDTIRKYAEGGQRQATEHIRDCQYCKDLLNQTAATVHAADTPIAKICDAAVRQANKDGAEQLLFEIEPKALRISSLDINPPLYIAVPAVVHMRYRCGLSLLDLDEPAEGVIQVERDGQMRDMKIVLPSLEGLGNV